MNPWETRAMRERRVTDGQPANCRNSGKRRRRERRTVLSLVLAAKTPRKQNQPSKIFLVLSPISDPSTRHISCVLEMGAGMSPKLSTKLICTEMVTGCTANPFPLKYSSSKGIHEEVMVIIPPHSKKTPSSSSSPKLTYPKKASFNASEHQRKLLYPNNSSAPSTHLLNSKLLYPKISNAAFTSEGLKKFPLQLLQIQCKEGQKPISLVCSNKGLNANSSPARNHELKTPQFPNVSFQGDPSIRADDIHQISPVQTALSRVPVFKVFDNLYVQVLVGKRFRKRFDANAIVQMLQKFDAPFGTTAYIEQSIPFPQDGKLNELVVSRQLAVEVSCLDKNLDWRLLLSCKRTLISLTDEEKHSLSSAVISCVIDPEVKGGMRWPLGKESLGDTGTSVCYCLATVGISC